MNKNNNIVNVAFFQFATSSIHFAASLEILNRECRLGNKTFYDLLGQTTYFPSRMAKMGESLLGKAPMHLKNLVFRADPNVAFKDKIEYDEIWVQKHMEEFTKQLNQISNISMLPSLQFDSIKPGAAIANEIITYSKDKDMNLLRYSSPFSFEGKPIEYCLSIIVEKNRVLINYSTWDKTTRIGIYEKNYIDSLITYK